MSIYYRSKGNVPKFKEGASAWSWDNVTGTNTEEIKDPWKDNQRSAKGSWNDNMSKKEVKAMQNKVGVKADGMWGDNSVKAYKNFRALEDSRSSDPKEVEEVEEVEEKEGKSFFSSIKGFAAENLGQDQWASHSEKLVSEAIKTAGEDKRQGYWERKDQEDAIKNGVEVTNSLNYDVKSKADKFDRLTEEEKQEIVDNQRQKTNIEEYRRALKQQKIDADEMVKFDAEGTLEQMEGMTPSEQMKKFGITSDMLNKQKGFSREKRNRFASKIQPRGYSELALNIGKVFKDGEDDDLGYAGLAISDDDKAREDQKRLYAGLPQKYGTMEVSGFAPQGSEGGSVYYSYADREQMASALLSELSDVEEFKKGSNKSFTSGYGGSRTNGVNALGKYWTDMGHDDRGTFMSMGDTMDYMEVAGVQPLGAGYKIYDRIYYKKDSRGRVFYQTGDENSPWKRWKKSTNKSPDSKLNVENASMRNATGVFNLIGDKILGKGGDTADKDQFKYFVNRGRHLSGKEVPDEYKYTDEVEEKSIMEGVLNSLGYVSQGKDRFDYYTDLANSQGFAWSEPKKGKSIASKGSGGILYRR